MRKLLSILIALALLFHVTAGYAQGMMMTGAGSSPKAAAGGGGGGITFTPTDAQTATPGFGAGTFTANIGTPSVDRIVIVSYQGNSGSSIPTLNGTAMNVAAGDSVATYNNALYYASVPTGTTATIGYGGGMSAVSIAVGILTGQSGGASATPVNPVTGSPPSVTMTIPAGGVGIIGAGAYYAGASPVFTWTGTTSSSGDEATGNATGALLGTAHATASGTISVSSVPAVSGGTMAGAAWGP
jgi:hypothetical protein